MQNKDFAGKYGELKSNLASISGKSSQDYVTATNSLAAFEKTAPDVVNTRDSNTTEQGITYHEKGGFQFFVGQQNAGIVVGEISMVFARPQEEQ